MDRYINTTDVASDSPPSEGFLFAQAVLGRLISGVATSEIKVKAHRAELEGLSLFSARHAQALRDLQAGERDARHGRQLLEWAAQISSEAREKLRAIQQFETQYRRARQTAEHFADVSSQVTEWNEVNHPRAPKGTNVGGGNGFQKMVEHLQSQTEASRRQSPTRSLSAIGQSQS